MKKNQKDIREFKKIKEQITQIKQVVHHTKVSNLWNHEATIRKKLKAIREMDGQHLKDYKVIMGEYRELLDTISQRLLDDYNEKNKTDFKFEILVKEHKQDYLTSGILTTLVSAHIPKMMADSFKKYFPANPKDEYEEARKLCRKIYLHLGDTNTGKTYQAIEKLKQSKSGIYLAPLRILALENFERLNEAGISCDLLTGEEEILMPQAHHQSSTVEKLNLESVYEVAVIDEIQLLSDAQRGQAFTRALLGLRCEEIHVCGAKNAKTVLLEIIEDCGDEFEVIEYVRQVPLQVEKQHFSMKDITPGDALILFSKRRVLQLAKHYKEVGVQTSIIYGDLPPEVRKRQYHDFISKNTDVIISTDAIGMGVNLPIRRIVFMNIQKFDGEEERYLTSQEVKQIAGRAGRKGIYEVGYVAGYGNSTSFVREKLEIGDEEIAQAVLGPSEALLKIKGLPLKEKLALWSNTEVESDLYRKMDIREYILILDKIKSYKLEEMMEWKLMKLPFDVHNNVVLSTFLTYIEQYFMKNESCLQKPTLTSMTLEDLENYYQKVNLYYSFSKNFNIDFEEQWVYDERIRISEQINELLINGKY